MKTLSNPPPGLHFIMRQRVVKSQLMFTIIMNQLCSTKSNIFIGSSILPFSAKFNMQIRNVSEIS